MGCPAAGGNQSHRPPGQIIGGFLGNFFAQMQGDLLDVIHHGKGILENMAVDALVDVTDKRATLTTSDDVGIVYMALGPGMSLDKLSYDLKLAGDLLDLLTV